MVLQELDMDPHCYISAIQALDKRISLVYCKAEWSTSGRQTGKQWILRLISSSSV